MIEVDALVTLDAELAASAEGVVATAGPTYCWTAERP
jgi:hypothetical protein